MEKPGSSSTVSQISSDTWELLYPVLYDIWICLHEKNPETCTHPLDVISILSDGEEPWDEEPILDTPDVQWGLGYIAAIANVYEVDMFELIREWVAREDRGSFGRDWYKTIMP
jgi:hypothetical protein